MKDKKVLHVVGHLGNGGDSTAILNLMDYMEKNNYGINFDFVTHNGCDVTVVNALREKGHTIFVLNGDVRNIGVFRYFKELYGILKQNNYFAIHFHTSFQSAVGLITAKICGINKRIVHSHTSAIQRKTSKMKELIYLPVCRFIINLFSTHKVACSKIAGDFLFGKRSNYDVIYNGINSDIAKEINQEQIKFIKKKIDYKDGDVLIGQVGRFDENKNQIFSIELMNYLPNNYKLIFLGENKIINQKLIKNKNIFFAGKVNNVQDYMCLFDFLLLPSKYGEGLPTVVIEEQIINDKCICLVSDIVTKECNLGNVVFVKLDKKIWKENILKKHIVENKINYKLFEISYTAKKWLEMY